MLDRNQSAVAILCATLLPFFAPAAEITIVSSQPPPPQWTFRLVRQDAPVPCRAGAEPRCVTNNIVIDNESTRTLECQAEIHYDGLNSEGFPKTVKPAVLMSRESRTVLSERALPDVAIASHNVTCSARAPLDVTRLTRSCKAKFDTSKVDLTAAYPPTSRRAAEEGPVVLEFSLTREEGSPKDVVIAGSSLFPRLDQAAVEAISRAKGSTDCELGRFMFRVDFKLSD